MTDRFIQQAERLIAMAETQDMAECVDSLATALSEVFEAGKREERERSRKMHRRAQKAEGKLARIEAAHLVACRYSFLHQIDYHLYGVMLLTGYPLLFPKTAAIRSREANPLSS